MDDQDYLFIFLIQISKNLQNVPCGNFQVGHTCEYINHPKWMTKIKKCILISLNVPRGNLELAICITLNHLEWMWGIIVLNFSFNFFNFEIMPWQHVIS